MVRKKFNEVKAFVKRVKKKFPDAKIILFGSRTGEDFLESSDYDFLIVSQGFNGVNFFERMEKMLDFWSLKKDFEALCYTPEEFKEKKSEIGIVQEALKKGILLA